MLIKNSNELYQGILCLIYQLPHQALTALDY